MARSQRSPVLEHIRQLVTTPATEDRTDRDLLQEFTANRSEAAFAELVRRHGRLVLTVCGRVLHHTQDVEDAYQATFLILARKAASIRNGGALASWLYGVAYRIAMKARSEAAKRRVRESQIPCPAPADPVKEATLLELQMLLFEEINRLPEKHRAAFVLCCLEGKSRAEAAEHLGWKEGTVAGRIALAREQLRQRLIQRGIALPAALAVLAITDSPASAMIGTMPPAETAAAVLSLAAGRPGAGAVISSRAAWLAQAGLQGLTMARIRAGLLVLLTSSVLAGTAALAWYSRDQQPAAAEPVAQSPPQEKANKPHVTASDRWDDPPPPGARTRLGTERFRLGGLVYACAYSPDGKMLAAASADHTIRLFEAVTGRPLRDLQGHLMDVTCLAYSPDGLALASGGGDGNIGLWNPATGKLIRMFQTEQQVVWSIASSTDGKSLLSGGQDGTMRHWDSATGKELRKFTGHQGPVRSVAVSPDGRLAASGSWDTTVRIWDVATGKEVREFTGHTPRNGATGSFVIHPVAFSPDGKLLASADEEPTVSLWEVGSGKLVRAMPAASDRLSFMHGNIWSLAFSRDGKTIATGGSSWNLRLWDVATGKLRNQRPGKDSTTYTGWHVGGIDCVAFAPDGKTLAFAEDNRLILWDTNSGQEISPVPVPSGTIRRVIFSADGKKLVTASDDQTQRLVEWDIASGRLVRPLLGKIVWAHLFALSPDQKVLVATGYNQALHLWDTATGKEIRQIPLPIQQRSASPEAVAYSADGQLLAGGGNFDDGSIRVWQAATGKEIRKLEGHGQFVWSVAFAPDNKLLASTGQDQEIRLHDLTTGKKLWQFRAPGGWGSGLIFSPDGKTLASIGNDRTVRLWDAASGKMLHQLAPGPGAIDFQQQPAYPAFSPDSRMVATGGCDQSVHLWEVVTGRQRRALPGHRGSIQALAFSPDGRTLASGSSDTTTLLWDVYGDGQPRLATGTAQELDALWTDLASSDAGRAYQALCRLQRAPEPGLSFLEKRLQPLHSVDAQRVGRMLKGLDSDSFAVRRQATQELEKLGEAAEPALRNALAGRVSPEARRRIEELLAKLRPDASPDRLRQLRAVEILEHWGTVRARQLLTDLARGVPTAFVTRQAQASLKRLAP